MPAVSRPAGSAAVAAGGVAGGPADDEDDDGDEQAGSSPKTSTANAVEMVPGVTIDLRSREPANLPRPAA